VGKILILAPNFDGATYYWHSWLTRVLTKYIRERGHVPVVLQYDEVSRGKVWETLEKEEIDAIAGVGHGNKDVYTGQFFESIFRSCQYPPELIKKRNFAPVSCLVGVNLLPDMVKKGLGAGIGEDVEYAFVASRGKKPLEDPNLARFTESEFTYWIALCEGKTHKEAHEMMIKAYEDAAKDATPHVRAVLLNDAKHRLRFGNEDWKLSPPEPGQPPEEGEYELAAETTLPERSGYGEGYLKIGRFRLPIKLALVLDKQVVKTKGVIKKKEGG